MPTPEVYTTSRDGIEVMHFYEKKVLVAYPDPGSELARGLARAGLKWPCTIPAHMSYLSGAPWSIGYGDTGPHVKQGDVISDAEADRRFSMRLAKEFEPGVARVLTRKPTFKQFDAMVSLAYNIGVGNFQSSTLLRKFNAGLIEETAEQFLVWNRSGGQVLLGLRRRRLSEKCLFNGATASEAIAIGQALP